MMTRFFDIILSGLALLFLSPLIIPIVISLKVTGEGEMFYVQERIGFGGKPFGLLKFATMLKNSPSIGSGTVTVKNDPRVLPMGKFLRKTKINELPQLINIFLGDMSVVGPRPLVKKGFDAYSPNVQASVSKVRPGLSGIGSVIFRDEESLLDGRDNPVDFHERVIGKYKGELEEWFVANSGLGVYFLVIFVTAWVIVFTRSNIAWRVFSGLPEPKGELSCLKNG
jgi:lipopolysaccharide/colanic/teichoic acid biosynthesis glycosyltransferase